MNKPLAWIVNLACCSMILISAGIHAQDLYTKNEISNKLQASEASAGSQNLFNSYNMSSQEARSRGTNPMDTLLLDANFDAFLENPNNFFSGPEYTDIGFIMTQKLIGSPAEFSLDVLKGNTPTNPSENVTAFSYLSRIAAFLGMFVVGILIFYIIVGGILNQAKDGEFLGRDWDSLYVPFRTAIAMLGTMPSPMFGGLSLSQILVLIIFLMGLGVGSATFTAMAPVLMGKPLVNASFDQKHVENMARSILASQICAIEQARGTSDAAMNSLAAQPFKVIVGAEGQDRKYTVVPNVPDGATCGKVSATIYNLSAATTDDVGFFSGASWDALLATGSGLTNNGYVKALIQNEVTSIMISEAIPKLYLDLWPIANFAAHPNLFAREHQAVIQGSGTGDWGLQYWKAIDAFQSRLNNAASRAVNLDLIQEVNEGFENLVAQNGMFLGGAYYYLITRRQAAMSQAIEDSLPDFDSIKLNQLRNSPWYADFWSKFVSFFSDLPDDKPTDPMSAAISVADGVILSAYQSSPSASFALMRANELASKNTGAGDLSANLGQAIAEYSTGFARIGEDTSSLNPDPILEMQSLGVKVQQALLAGYLYDKAGDQVLDKMFTGDEEDEGGFSVGTLVFAAMLSSLLLIAFLYSTIIPMLPLIMFSISALGLILLLIKAMIAAPFWWAMHAHPAGRDLIGKAGSGYPLLLTLSLSPFLMVTGLIGAIALTRLSGWFLNIVMMPSITVMNNGFTAPSNWVSYFVGYGIIMLVVVYKNFGLIYELRQVVLKWMGVDQGYTDFGEKDAQMKAVGLGAYASTVISRGEQVKGRG